MNKIKIPKRFKLFGQTIEIVFDEKLFVNEDMFGSAEYRKSKILIQPKISGNSLNDYMIEETFFHELLHWILYKLDEHKLRSNEKFVDGVSQLLHQAFQTMEY